MSESAQPKPHAPATERSLEKQPVKLLIYSHSFSPNIGGVESISMSLARGLAEMPGGDGLPGFEVIVATQTPRGKFDDASLQFLTVRQPGFWKLLGLIRSADVVHLAGPSFLPMLLVKLARKPFVIEHHTYQAICPNGLLIHQPERDVCPGHFQARKYSKCYACQAAEFSKLKSLLRIASAFPRLSLVRSAAANVAVTDHVKKRIAVSNALVIQHGIDSRAEADLSELAPKGKLCFAFVGRFVPEKGAPIFLSALAELRRQGLPFEALLIGDGPARESIEAQIKQDDLESVATITGYLTGKAFSDAMSRAHVVVMPSVWEETAGLAAIEQMIRKRLVIASDIGGLTEITGDTALKYPAGDSKALAECMKRTIENPQLITELGNMARQRALERFSITRMLEEHAALYKLLVRN